MHGSHRRRSRDTKPAVIEFSGCTDTKIFCAVRFHCSNHKASDVLLHTIMTTVTLSCLTPYPRVFLRLPTAPLPNSPWRLDAARHPPWPQFPVDTSVFFGVRLYICVCVCGQQRSAVFSQPSWDWQMESFHTQTERQDTGNRGVFNSPGAAVVGINLGQWRSAHRELAFP